MKYLIDRSERGLRLVSRILSISLLLSIATQVAFGQAPKAQWMSGTWGIGFRINADNKDNIENYDVDTLVAQVVGIGGVEYVMSLASSYMSLKINWLEATASSFVVLKSPSS